MYYPKLKNWIKLRYKVITIILALVITISTIIVFYTSIPRRKPVIGVIKIHGYIITEYSKEMYLKAIREAERNDTIVGVVVRVYSPGGTASTVEHVYYSLKRLSRVKPVVVCIEGLAASGGYYISLAGDYIIAEPTSFIGNVGVIALMPPLIIPSEILVETGPYKYTGFKVSTYCLIVKEALDNFLKAVKEGRGDRLKIPLSNLSQGMLYIGSKALELGLIDRLGSLTDAISLVANLTGVKEYEVVEITKREEAELAKDIGHALWLNRTKLTIEFLRRTTMIENSLYYLSPLFINSSSYVATIWMEQIPIFMSREVAKNYGKESVKGYPSVEENRFILIDGSHKNYIPLPLMSSLLGELNSRGYKVVIVSEKEKLKEYLKKNPKCLIVMTPTADYERDTIKAIKEYIGNCGRLLLLHEPAGILAKSINSLAQEFGVYFTDGYLYNMKENYGIYRNIIVKEFSEHKLMSNISKLVFFTCTHVYTNGTGLAFTSNSTYHSIFERRGKYTPIVMAMRDRVLAIGDVTVILDPFNNVEDNLELVKNIVRFMIEENEEPK